MDVYVVALPLPRAAFVRECVQYYESILPRPTEEEYTANAQALVAKYPAMKDKGTFY